MAEHPTTLALAPILVDRREAARLLGVSPGTIDNLRTRGELPSVKIRSRRLFDVADLHRYVESMKGPDPTTTPPRNDAAPLAGGACVTRSNTPPKSTSAPAAPSASANAPRLEGGAA